MKTLAQSDLWRFDQVVKSKPIITNGTSRVLGKFRQVFLMTLFPDQLIVEELRIVWVKRNGPWTNEVISIMATDIACVNASTGPFFGHIHIKSLTGGPEILVNSMTRKNVYRIRSLVEGIALASREGLQIESDDLEAERQNLYRAGEIR
ncbi:hypothetical protein A3D81_01815 [Candidatus Curtissbacteria bacterium RIFCSPHIGHO2_02_FULL_40_17]|uniref:YokE-like PH domain-containing protein n=4 Tax=Candidatus Curtissiibacteriota TaxID=1752717 RepID=A0A1F5GG77_9BACT|nr:MAG: hypothetical protein A2693_02570 [Candidatus Curtissbacteria bacterium RIFCSPHIGHO2_01_FULL_40_12]OGD90855.1 MAG: hypothetical protein A3D81_01815 [Candidatus Curtissbacteria bacterium RIFCSPHIGHO2_02_FULL_40_17]OGE05755.1 MAG: hypothetical protein A3F45_04085 [Candidatus Curtissbacteria bacterium RIFCSPHIGHO2_12_FULL_41_17]OGE08769.1 MAG: hypothetical protein A3I53_00205 [Candidatus Curtissbacteria bacterium RIFCSPLOWO2_02_FULL_40_13b]